MEKRPSPVILPDLDEPESTARMRILEFPDKTSKISPNKIFPVSAQPPKRKLSPDLPVGAIHILEKNLKGDPPDTQDAPSNRYQLNRKNDDRPTSDSFCNTALPKRTGKPKISMRKTSLDLPDGAIGFSKLDFNIEDFSGRNILQSNKMNHSTQINDSGGDTALTKKKETPKTLGSGKKGFSQPPNPPRDTDSPEP